MVTRYKIERTENGWWFVMSRQWLAWKRDEFMYSTRDLAEDRLRDMKGASDRLSVGALSEQARQPAALRP
jgi:hypothetical protein